MLRFIVFKAVILLCFFCANWCLASASLQQPGYASLLYEFSDDSDDAEYEDAAEHLPARLRLPSGKFENYGSTASAIYCCVCSAEGNLYAFKDAHYCKKDFNDWILREFNKACSAEGSDFLRFTAQTDGTRKVNLHDSSDDWRNFIDESLQAAIAEEEQAAQFEPSKGCLSPVTKDWLLQSVYSLKTFNNVLCCCMFCASTAEEMALEEKCPGSSLWGNPYYERCPHCLSRVERLRGCPHMVCRNPNCEEDYSARCQVECPLVLCSIGCNIDCLNCDEACWVIGACERCKCRVPCIPLCGKRCFCKCFSSKPESVEG